MASVGKRLTNSGAAPCKALTSGQKTKPNLIRTAPGKQKLSFSFAYFKQYEHFGLGGATTHWFGSLIDRLKDLSEKEANIIGDYTQRQQYRIHTVDWGKTNIPIQRDDLDSVPKAYRENEADFPFWQFQLSKSTGRVAGFLDESSSVFYIVLIDPKHNLQPTLDHGYKVDVTTPLPTTYEIALRNSKKCAHSSSCPLGLEQQTSEDLLRALFIDTDDSAVIDGLRRNGLSFHDAFIRFILELIEASDPMIG